MKVFITGVSGFVGRHLYDRYSPSHTVVSYRRGQDVTEVLDAFQPDLILHAAAEIYDVNTIFESNVVLTMSILEYIKKSRAQMISFGSTSEYGWRDIETSESTILHPHTAYAGSKAACTMLCQGWATEFDLDIVTLRLYSVYGAGEKPHRMFPQLWKSFMLDRTIQLVNGVHDFVYIRDVVDAVDLVVNNVNRTPGEVVNVSNGIEYTNEQVLNMFESVLGRTAPVEFDRERFVTQPVWCGNSDLLKNKYQWQPKYDLKAGVTDFIQQAKYE